MIHESEEKDNQTEGREESSKTYLVIQRVIAKMCEEKLRERERERKKKNERKKGTYLM